MKNVPFDRMKEYAMSTIHLGPPANGNLWQVQALWQETGDSVTVGVKNGKSLLEEESLSNLNHLSAAWLKSNNYFYLEKVNMWEVNNVCNGGLEILQVFRSYIPLPIK